MGPSENLPKTRPKIAGHLNPCPSAEKFYLYVSLEWIRLLASLPNRQPSDISPAITI